MPVRGQAENHPKRSSETLGIIGCPRRAVVRAEKVSSLKTRVKKLNPNGPGEGEVVSSILTSSTTFNSLGKHPQVERSPEMLTKRAKWCKSVAVVLGLF